MRKLQGISSLTKLWPDRQVNSIYFDSANLDNLLDNLAGIKHRFKHRLRWYGNDNLNHRGNSALFFEVKEKAGSSGRKIIHKINSTPKNTVTHDFILKCIEGRLRKVDAHRFSTPQIQCSYIRSYYQLQNGIRVTLDRSINFFPLKNSMALSVGHKFTFDRAVVELKFPLQLEAEARDFLNDANLQPTRHSKYVSGMALLGHCKYL